MNRSRSERYADDLTIRSDVSVSSKLRISPFLGGKLVALLACSFFRRGGLIRSVDPVEVVFVYQRVGGLSSYDRVFLSPVNIFSESLKEGLSHRLKVVGVH